MAGQSVRSLYDSKFSKRLVAAWRDIMHRYDTLREREGNILRELSGTVHDQQRAVELRNELRRIRVQQQGLLKRILYDMGIAPVQLATMRHGITKFLEIAAYVEDLDRAFTKFLNRMNGAMVEKSADPSVLMELNEKAAEIIDRVLDTIAHAVDEMQKLQEAVSSSRA